MSNEQQATSAIAPKYTPEQESVILAYAERANRPLNIEDAKILAESLDKTSRSVTAKILSMGLEYAKAKRARKDGTAVESKADIVQRIEHHLGIVAGSLTAAKRDELLLLASALGA